MTERALELAYRLKDSLAKGKKDERAKNMSKWDDDLWAGIKDAKVRREVRRVWECADKKTYDEVSFDTCRRYFQAHSPCLCSDF